MVPLERLADFVNDDGPELHEYPLAASCFQALDASKDADVIREIFAPTLTTECIHGHGHLKPYGYAGDFEMIDRIYTNWVSPSVRLARWDRFFHAQAAPRAVRNRKEFFKRVLQRLGHRTGSQVHVLNVGCGPGRDIAEYFQASPDTRIHVLNLDLDPKAVEYAEALCSPYRSRVGFACQNIFKFVPDKQYDLVLAAGLFDYFSDRLFVRATKKLLQAVKRGGELIIGNFGLDNPSRTYMEVLGRWHLEHRSEAQLLALAKQAGAPPSSTRIEREPEGVNLFLRIVIGA